MVENAELIAIIALGSAYLGGIGAAFALGNLPKRSEFNELRKEVKAVDDKIEASHKELSAKIDESHANLIAEIRRSHQQVMRALINHRHPEPEGEPVFTEPPDTELIAADN